MTGKARHTNSNDLLSLIYFHLTIELLSKSIDGYDQLEVRRFTSIAILTSAKRFKHVRLSVCVSLCLMAAVNILQIHRFDFGRNIGSSCA